MSCPIRDFLSLRSRRPSPFVCIRAVSHTGSFPIELFSGDRLVLIDLSANSYSGAIDFFIAPSALSGLLRYYYPLALNLSANAFRGTLPPLSTIEARNVTFAADAARSTVSSVVDVRSQVRVRVFVFVRRDLISCQNKYMQLCCVTDLKS